MENLRKILKANHTAQREEGISTAQSEGLQRLSNLAALVIFRGLSFDEYCEGLESIAVETTKKLASPEIQHIGKETIARRKHF